MTTTRTPIEAARRAIRAGVQRRPLHIADWAWRAALQHEAERARRQEIAAKPLTEGLLDWLRSGYQGLAATAADARRMSEATRGEVRRMREAAAAAVGGTAGQQLTESQVSQAQLDWLLDINDCGPVPTVRAGKLRSVTESRATSQEGDEVPTAPDAVLEWLRS
jgi:hypothetical protein